MSAENNGNQQIIWKYYTPLQSTYLFSEMSGISKVGLVTRPSFSVLDGTFATAVITPFSCFVHDFGSNEEAFFKVTTKSNASLFIPSTARFICYEYTYAQEIDWFGEFVTYENLPENYRGVVIAGVVCDPGTGAIVRFLPNTADFSDLFYRNNDISLDFHLEAANPRDVTNWDQNLVRWYNSLNLLYSKNHSFSQFAAKITGENAIIDISGLTEDTVVGVILDEEDLPKVSLPVSGKRFFYTIGKIIVNSPNPTSSDVEFESYLPQPLDYVSAINYYGVAAPGVFTEPALSFSGLVVTVGQFTAFIKDSSDSSGQTVHKVFTAPHQITINYTTPYLCLRYNGTSFIWEALNYVPEDYVGICFGVAVFFNSNITRLLPNCDHSSAYYKANYIYSEFVIEPASPRGIFWSSQKLQWVKTTDLCYLDGTVVLDTTGLNCYIDIGNLSEAKFLGIVFDFVHSIAILSIEASANDLTFLLGKLTPPSLTPAGGLTAADVEILTYFPREPQNRQVLGDVPNIFKVNSVNTEAIWNTNDLNISTLSQETMRQKHLDQGNKYLSELGEVYHFDVDLLNQNKENPISVEGYPWALVDGSDSTASHDFTPLLVPFSPFYEEGRSFTGKASLTKIFNETQVLTVSFWVKFFEISDTVILDFGSFALGDHLRLLQLQEQVSYADLTSNVVYGKKSGDLTPYSTFSEPETYIEHQSPAFSEKHPFNSLKPGFWYAIALSLNPVDIETGVQTATISIGHFDILLDQWVFEEVICTLFSSGSRAFPAVVNASKSDFLIDELYFDYVPFPHSDFRLKAQTRYPWAAIKKDNNSLVLSTDSQKFFTNIFGPTGLFVQTLFDFIYPLNFEYRQEDASSSDPNSLFGSHSTWETESSTYPKLWVRTV